MPRKQFPIEIQIRDRIKDRSILIGLDHGIYKNQLHVSFYEKDKNNNKTRKESLSYKTKLNKALENKLLEYLKTITDKK